MIPKSKRQALFILGILSLLNPDCESQVLDGADYIVNLHNKVRRYVGKGHGIQQIANMRKINWDPLLALEAATWSTCENLGFAKPDTDYDDLGHPLRGMNVAVGGENDTLSKLIRNWFTEKNAYDETFNICYPDQDCENYMQMVNAETERIGCAVKPGCMVDGRKYQYLVCVYAPGINWEILYKRGLSCSKCPDSAPFCQAGLCVSCDRENTSLCECRKTCHKRKVGYGILNGKTCTCSCVYGKGPNCDEECENKEQYANYDICASIPPETCQVADPTVQNMIQEFCPAKCSCNPIPYKLRWL